MKVDQATIGRRVKALVCFSGVPEGTEGIIDEDYGTGVMVAWDLPGRPLPPGYRQYDGEPTIRTPRDGFDKKTELGLLAIVRR